MCFGALFAAPKKKRKTSHSESNEKRWNEQSDRSRHYERIPIVAEAAERPDTRRSKEMNRRVPRAPPTVDRRTRPSYTQNSGARHRPTLAVNVPPMWYRPTGSTSSNSSEEMLLNPRPDRSSHDKSKRHRHAKHTSQSTLKGRGAKRQRSSNTRCDDHVSSHATPNSSKRRSQTQGAEYSSPRSNRSTRQHQHHYQTLPSEPSPAYSRRLAPSEPQPSPTYSRRLAPHPSHQYHHHSARANTAAPRDPVLDRRFAVLAATNTALEHLRQEAFSQPSPPPPPRLRRYQGVQIPASSIPFDWSCVSSQTQSEGRYAEGSASASGRHRRRR